MSMEEGGGGLGQCQLGDLYVCNDLVRLIVSTLCCKNCDGCFFKLHLRFLLIFFKHLIPTFKVHHMCLTH